MTSTVVILYRCADCGKQRYTHDIEGGDLCKCGSNRYKLQRPHFMSILSAIIHDDKVRALYIKENLLRGRIFVGIKKAEADEK